MQILPISVLQAGPAEDCGDQRAGLDLECMAARRTSAAEFFNLRTNAEIEVLFEEGTRTEL
jgi:hypothetical protein